MPIQGLETPVQPFVTPPIDAIGAAEKMATLKNLLGQNQMIPGALQEQTLENQQRTRAITKADLENRQSQLELDSQTSMMNAWKDPSFTQNITGGTSAASSGMGFDPDAMIKGLVGRGVLPKDAVAAASSFTELAKNAAMKTKDDLSNYKDSHDQLFNLLAPIADMAPDKAAQSLASLKQKLMASPLPGLDPVDAQLLQAADVEHLPAMLGVMGFTGKLLDFHKDQADAAIKIHEADIKKLEADEKGSPLLKMENDPSMMAGDKLPASMAYLEGKVKDSDPVIAARATRLLATAKTAQQVELSIDAAKKATAQAIQDGDPLSAGKMLFDGTVAPSQIASARKSEFAQKAFAEAARLGAASGQQWSAQKAEADFKVAGSPANVAFFGSAKSLTDKGGTLDQLADAGKDIPQGQFPIFNSVADALKASTGSGPIAKYAAIALGVADDYAKVMGGGVGSDTSRNQALQLITAKESPAARAASIEGIRGSVGSQTKSRVGNNSVMQKMYGDNLPETPAAKSAGGGSAQKGGQFSVTAPDGSVHPFATKAQADKFKELANIK